MNSPQEQQHWGRVGGGHGRVVFSHGTEENDGVYDTPRWLRTTNDPRILKKDDDGPSLWTQSPTPNLPLQLVWHRPSSRTSRRTYKTPEMMMIDVHDR